MNNLHNKKDFIFWELSGLLNEELDLRNYVMKASLQNKRKLSGAVANRIRGRFAFIREYIITILIKYIQDKLVIPVQVTKLNTVHSEDDCFFTFIIPKADLSEKSSDEIEYYLIKEFNRFKRERGFLRDVDNFEIYEDFFLDYISNGRYFCKSDYGKILDEMDEFYPDEYDIIQDYVVEMHIID